MFEHLDDTDPPQPGPGERARVSSRAEALVHHRRVVAGLCIAVAVVLVAAVPGVLSAAGGGAKHVHTAGAPATTPTTGEGPDGVVNPITGEVVPGSSATTTTSPAQVLGSSITRPPTTRASTTQQSGGAAPGPSSFRPTPTTMACRNSSDPACGPFRWDPDPGPNQPMTGQLTFDPPNPKAGDTVTFHIVASDPDAQPVTICNAMYGGGEAGYVCDPAPRMNPSSCPAQYGPWTPPARQPGNLDTLDPHTYPNAGMYEVSFDLGSAMGDCNNPYASRLTLKTTVVVS